MSTRDRRDRGVDLAAIGIWLLAFLAFTVVAIDLGRLAMTATEAQNVADAAATAGAHALADNLSATDVAHTVAGLNVLNGAGATADEVLVEEGNYVQGDGFVPVSGGETATAVRATAHTTVHHIIAGVFGESFATSDVSRVGVAGFTGPGACPTNYCFPLCIGECDFPALEDCFNDESCLPRLVQVPSTTDNTGWTGFLSTANAGN